ncbi:MAG: hypothetical protein Q7U53_17240 [Anaerolineaceae bacterium]|nr:hypothetical protein [Anaerolineaceae bacterium]
MDLSESIAIKKAFLDVKKAEATYDTLRCVSNNYWTLYGILADYDPREVDPNSTDQEVENFRNMLHEYRSLAVIKDMEKSSALAMLDKAKNNLLELYED